MGGFAALHVGISYAKRARSLVVAGCGYGAEPENKDKFRAECEAAAASFERDWAGAAGKYALPKATASASCIARIMVFPSSSKTKRNVQENPPADRGGCLRNCKLI